MKELDSLMMLDLIRRNHSPLVKELPGLKCAPVPKAMLDNFVNHAHQDIDTIHQVAEVMLNVFLATVMDTLICVMLKQVRF